MKRMITLVCVLAFSSAFVAQVAGDTAIPLQLQNAELAWSDASGAALIGDTGAFTIERTDQGEEPLTFNITITPTDTQFTEFQVTDIAFDNMHSEGHAGRTWSGQMNGEPVSGTLRVLTDDLQSDNVRLYWQASNSSGSRVLDVTVTTDIDSAHDFCEPLAGSSDVWPWVSYCGCDGLNTLCAGPPDCANPTACPSGSGDTCGWHIIFDPWTNEIQDGSSSKPLPLP